GDGRYGGPLENRTRFLRSVVEGIRARVPGLGVAVRLSAFDMVPFRKDDAGIGTPETASNGYASAFGLLDAGAEDLDEALADARALLTILDELGVRWVCVTAGSPYYNPHIQRPPLLPPSDGYLPPAAALAAERRLPAARGSARRRRAPDRRDGASQARVPADGDRRIRVQLPPGLAAARRAAQRPSRPHRFRRPRTHGALVSRAARGRARRPPAPAQAHLPHLQRLHHRSAPRPGVGLLSPR